MRSPCSLSSNLFPQALAFSPFSPYILLTGGFFDLLCSSALLRSPAPAPLLLPEHLCVTGERLVTVPQHSSHLFLSIFLHFNGNLAHHLTFNSITAASSVLSLFSQPSPAILSSPSSSHLSLLLCSSLYTFHLCSSPPPLTFYLFFF